MFGRIYYGPPVKLWQVYKPGVRYSCFFLDRAATVQARLCSVFHAANNCMPCSVEASECRRDGRRCAAAAGRCFCCQWRHINFVKGACVVEAGIDIILVRLKYGRTRSLDQMQEILPCFARYTRDPLFRHRRAAPADPSTMLP